MWPAGSERHLLEGIFNDPARPFYNSVVFMQLLPIEEGVTPRNPTQS